MKKPVFLFLLCGLFIVLWIGLRIFGQTTAIVPQAESKPVNGLQMLISRDQAARGSEKAMSLTIKFRNLTTQNMTLLLGAGCGKGFGGTNAVRLILTGPNDASPVLLPFLGPGPPYSGGICGGVVGHAVAVLPAGASKSYPLKLGNYMDLTDSKKYRETHFPPGTYSLQTQLSLKPSDYNFQHPPTTPAWTGTIASNALQIHFDKGFAVPLDERAQQASSQR